MSLAVRMRGITKRFGALTALDRVDLEVEAGSIHAVVGENGAGKTTLMNVLYGALVPEEGTVEVEGLPRRFRSSREAIAAGIGMVSQHYAIIPELTCLQNLILGAEEGPWIDRARAARRAGELAARMGFEFDWDARAEGLGPAGAQKLEILKLLWRNSRILILDEPTAMLSPADSEALFENLRRLQRDGSTVLLVTHRLPEVLDYADAVTVLRQGRKVVSCPVAGLDAGRLAEWIVGHAMPERSIEPFEKGEPWLEVRELSVRGPRGNWAVREASFTLRKGELVGVAGVDGSGQRELFEALVGTRRAASGDVLLAGRPLAGLAPRERLAAGVRLIPEDRLAEGAVEDWSLLDNACLGLQRLAPLARGPWSVPRERVALAERVARRFATKHDGLSRPLRSLSGGNQQRFVAARALEIEPRLILAFQPARGLDIDATRMVYDALRRRCREGAAALVVSFDLDELLENADRLLVMYAGRVTEAPGLDRAEVGRLMVGRA